MEEKQSSASSTIVFGVAMLLLAGNLLWALWNFADLALSAINFPFPLDYGEAPILDQVMRLSRGENIYRPDLAQPPYVVSNHPPVMHILLLPFAAINGPAFWYGRALSITSAIVTALLIALTVRALTKDWIASLIASVLLFSFPYVTGWAIFSRVDTPALMFSLAGLYSVVRWPHRSIGIAMAFICFVLAAGTKQTYIFAGPLTSCIWLWHVGRRTFAIGLAAALLVTGGTLLLLFNIATEGGFTTNIITANANPFEPSIVMDYFINLFVRAEFLIVGLVLFIIVARLGDHVIATAFVIIYLIASALVAIMVGKVGSSINYLYEFTAALCIGTGVAVGWAGKNNWLKTLIAAIIAIQSGALSSWTEDAYLIYVRQKIAAYQEVAKLAQIVKQNNGQVLADEWMGLLPQLGFPLSYQPFEYYMLAQAKMWKTSDLQARIQRLEFKAILLYNPSHFNSIEARWPKPIRQTIYAHYRLEQRLAETLVYVPK